MKRTQTPEKEWFKIKECAADFIAEAFSIGHVLGNMYEETSTRKQAFCNKYG